MKDELLLTERDHTNYIALVRAVLNKPLLGRPRSNNERFSNAQRFAIMHEQDYTCPLCNREYEGDNNNSRRFPTTEHVIPFKFGGRKSKHNCILICQGCNSNRDIRMSRKKQGHDNLIKIIEEHYGPIDFTLIPDIIIKVKAEKFDEL